MLGIFFLLCWFTGGSEGKQQTNVLIQVEARNKKTTNKEKKIFGTTLSLVATK